MKMTMLNRVARACAPILIWSLLPGPTPVNAQSPQFRGEPTHAGTVATRGIHELAGVAWRFQTGGTVRSSPALVDGVLYVGSSDGFLYSLHAATGALLWRYEVGGPVASSPAVTDGVVLIAGRDGTLHGVDASRGQRLWRLETGPELALPWGYEGWDYLLSSPALADGTAYWGSGDGRLYALDPTSGDVRWTFRAGARIRSTPAVADGLVVFGDSHGFVHALDAADGQPRWRFESAGVSLDATDFGFDRMQISSSPVIVDGSVYVGSRDASLYALRADDGTVRWTFDEESAWVIATPAVDDVRVYSARSSSGVIRAIDRAGGAEAWQVSTDGVVFSSPVLADGVVHVGRGDGHLSGFDAETGAELWSYRTGGGIYSTPVVHAGRAYVGSDDGAVYAFAAADGAPVHTAVFFDQELASRAALGSRPEHARLTEYFTERGYGLLDAAGLRDFLEARIADRAPSVIVFVMDALPEGVARFDGADSPLRSYLETGGKAVWPGRLPGLVVFDPETGRPTRLDRTRPQALLDVDLSAFNGDRYSVRVTPAGRAWGLQEWWVGSAATRPEHVTEVLAVDAIGRAAAWVKRYGGGPGTGFVRVRASVDPGILEEIRRVAEVGLAPAAAAVRSTGETDPSSSDQPGGA